MLRDALTQLADGQAFTAGTTYTTYCYDTGNTTPKRDMGAGEPLCLVFSLGVAAAGSTDTTQLGASSGTSATDGSTGAKILATATIANALLTIGSQHVIVIPPSVNIQRYLYGRVVLGSGDTVTADVDLMPLSLVPKTAYHADSVTWS